MASFMTGWSLTTEAAMWPMVTLEELQRITVQMSTLLLLHSKNLIFVRVAREKKANS